MSYESVEFVFNGKTYEIDIQNLVSTIAKLEHVVKDPNSSEQFLKTALNCVRNILHEIVIDPEQWTSGSWTDQRIESVNFDDFIQRAPD